MKYDFDEIIDRTNTNSENVEGWRKYIFNCGPEKTFPYADSEFIRMWVADMEFAVAPEIRQAIKDRLDRRILGYTMVFDEGYYEALNNWCRQKYEWNIPKEEIVFSPGVIPALYQLVEDLVGKGEKVLTMTPAYGFFLHACEYNSVELVKSPLKRSGGSFDPDFEDLEKKASDPKVKMLLLCNPHNPTGRVWKETELRRIGEIAEKNGLWIVSDEIHCDLLRKGVRHIPMGKVMPEYKKLITTMSASKTFNLAGMLFSNIIIRDPQERKRFKRRDKTAGSVNPLSIAAHKGAYEHGGAWLEELKEYLDGNFRFTADFLKEKLPGAEFIMPEATYFAWVGLEKLLPDETDLPLFFANNAGVLLEGGDKLFVDNAGGYIRLNLAMPISLVKEGLRRIEKAISVSKNLR